MTEDDYIFTALQALLSDCAEESTALFSEPLYVTEYVIQLLFCDRANKFLSAVH